MTPRQADRYGPATGPTTRPSPGRRTVLGVALAGLVALGSAAGTAAPRPDVATTAVSHRSTVTHRSTVSSRSVLALANPAADTAADATFVDACQEVGASPAAQRACVAAAVPALDAARAAEGVGPVTLPTDWAVLPPAVQLLVIADLERVDRGLVPVAGLSSSLDALAAVGAVDDNDPPFPVPFDGSLGGGNWSGGISSPLLSDFEWMYDDGLGSYNLDCTPSDTAGCWGHRDNILAGYGAPLLMGAATDPTAAYGNSSAEEFIGSDRGDRADVVTWASLVTRIPLGVSTTAVHLSGSAGRDSAAVRIWASGEAMTATVLRAPGAASWVVGPRRCLLGAGRQCSLSVAHTGQATTGTLLVAGPNGVIPVSLAWSDSSLAEFPTPVTPVAVLHAMPAAGPALDVTGILRSRTGAPLVGQQVLLVGRFGSGRTWRVVGSALTGPAGRATFALTARRGVSLQLVSTASVADRAVASGVVTLPASA